MINGANGNTELWGLKGKIREKKYTMRSLAPLLDMSPSCLCNKLNGRADFNGQQIQSLAELVDIDRAAVGDYFFPNLKNF